MPLIDREGEALRKENLRKLEDMRVAFAEKLDKQGIKPERMFFCSSEEGSFVALARLNKQYIIITSPVFGQEGEFRLYRQDTLSYEREDIFEKGSGLNGAFGFGKKGARGFKLTLNLDGGESAVLPVVAGRTSWLDAPLKKNPLLRTKRRRGDANIVWDLLPIEPSQLPKIEAMLQDYYFA